MSYHPYFRGKQYELICIKENAEILSRSEFSPIIEPVKGDAGSIIRCLSEVKKFHGRAYIVANPGCGALKAALPDTFRGKIQEFIDGYDRVSWLYRTSGLIDGSLGRDGGAFPLLHDGSEDVFELAENARAGGAVIGPHIFVDSRDSGALYRRKFQDNIRVLVRDGFRKKKNSEYLSPDIEHFSDLYLTYKDEGLDGFGDFLTVGEEYSDGGGPAYAVAIHLTYIDQSRNSSIFIRHFVSDSNLTPADPAGKFAEALEKLAIAVRAPGSRIVKTKAVAEFLDLYDRDHYPGLGYVKKLSMQHHIELMSRVING